MVVVEAIVVTAGAATIVVLTCCGSLVLLVVGVRAHSAGVVGHGGELRKKLHAENQNLSYMKP